MDVGTPHPAGLTPSLQEGEGRRLRIVDDHDIVLLFQPRRLAPAVVQVGRLLLGAEGPVRALQRVVHGFRHLEEGLVSADDLPVGHQAQIVQQADERTQEL